MGAIQLVGSVAGPLIGGIEDRSQLKAAAAADRENAQRIEYQGELDSYETRRQARLAQGEGLAMAASTGNVVGTGSIVDLVEQAAIEREMEIGNIRAKARGEAANLRTSAAGKDKAAGMALFKGILGGALGYAATKADQKNAARITAQTGVEQRARLPGSSSGNSFVEPSAAYKRSNPNWWKAGW